MMLKQTNSIDNRQRRVFIASAACTSEKEIDKPIINKEKTEDEGPDDESDDEDDSDDDLESFEHHIAMLASSSNSRFPAACSSSSSGVSSLRLNSLLRLSSQSCRSSMSSNETLSCLSKSPYSFVPSPALQESMTTKMRPSTSEALENAFKGIVEDDNEVSQDSMQTTSTSSEDFWSQVEF
ncbi:hypothetical protein OSTOST_10629 [Ostertagia ostertagi]